MLRLLGRSWPSTLEEFLPKFLAETLASGVGILVIVKIEPKYCPQNPVLLMKSVTFNLMGVMF